ncbi:hypothetical protein [Actinoplanes ianthinogenes]|nr:hypothetical protein [Actinoplanes ianthinogenes]
MVKLDDTAHGASRPRPAGDLTATIRVNSADEQVEHQADTAGPPMPGLP